MMMTGCNNGRNKVFSKPKVFFLFGHRERLLSQDHVLCLLVVFIVFIVFIYLFKYFAFN